MSKFVIFLKDINDIVISDIQQLTYNMNNTNFNNIKEIKPIIDNKMYYVGEKVKIIEIDYFDMYIKIINEQGSILTGQIIEGLDIEFKIPSDIYIKFYKKDKESYYIYGLV